MRKGRVDMGMQNYSAVLTTGNIRKNTMTYNKPTMEAEASFSYKEALADANREYDYEEGRGKQKDTSGQKNNGENVIPLSSSGSKTIGSSPLAELQLMGSYQGISCCFGQGGSELYDTLQYGDEVYVKDVNGLVRTAPSPNGKQLLVGYGTKGKVEYTAIVGGEKLAVVNIDGTLAYIRPDALSLEKQMVASTESKDNSISNNASVSDELETENTQKNYSTKKIEFARNISADWPSITSIQSMRSDGGIINGGYADTSRPLSVSLSNGEQHILTSGYYQTGFSMPIILNVPISDSNNNTYSLLLYLVKNPQNKWIMSINQGNIDDNMTLEDGFGNSVNAHMRPSIIEFDSNGSYKNAYGDNFITLTMGNGTQQKIPLDFSKTTQFTGASTISSTSYQEEVSAPQTHGTGANFTGMPFSIIENTNSAVSDEDIVSIPSSSPINSIENATSTPTRVQNVVKEEKQAEANVTPTVESVNTDAEDIYEPVKDTVEDTTKTNEAEKLPVNSIAQADETKSDVKKNPGEFIEVYRDNSSVKGSFGDDIIFAKADDVNIDGDGGKDIIYVEGNKASVYGDDGDDTISVQGYNASIVDGGDGDDTISVNDLIDRLDGGDGDDTISVEYAGVFSDIDGGDGNDTISVNELYGDLYGGNGDDAITANGKQSMIYGDDGNDTISVNGYYQTVHGGDGNNNFSIEDGYGTVIYDFDEDNDTLSFASSYGKLYAEELTEKTSLGANIHWIAIKSDEGTVVTLRDYYNHIKIWNVQKFINAHNAAIDASIVANLNPPTNIDSKVISPVVTPSSDDEVKVIKKRPEMKEEVTGEARIFHVNHGYNQEDGYQEEGGLFITNLNSDKNKDSKKPVTFDVYNTMDAMGIVEYYDEDGNFIGADKISPHNVVIKDFDSWWEKAKNTFDSITKYGINGGVPITHPSISKHESIEAPAGTRTIMVTNNQGASVYAMAYNWVDELFKAEKLVKNIKSLLNDYKDFNDDVAANGLIENVKESLVKKVVHTIQKNIANMQEDKGRSFTKEEAAKTLISTLTSQSKNGVKDWLLNDFDLKETLVDAMQNALKNVGSTAASIAFSVVEDLFKGNPALIGFEGIDLVGNVLDNLSKDLTKKSLQNVKPMFFQLEE